MYQLVSNRFHDRSRKQAAASLHAIPDRTDNRFRHIAHVVLFFFAMNPSVLFMGGRGASAGLSLGNRGETSAIFYVLALVCFSVSSLGIWLRLKFTVMPLLRAVPVWLIVAYAFASVLWSIEPSHTLSRATGFLGTTLAAALIATFPRAAQLRIMALTFGTVLLASLLLTAVAPELSISTYRGETTARGIYVHKNIYGWAACLFTLVIFGAWRARSIGTMRAALFLAAGIAGICLSRSASSICALGVGFSVMAAMSILRRTRRARSVFTGLSITVVVGLVGLSWLLLPFFLEVFGKTDTLSGRTRLWQALKPAMSERLATGWGFGGALWQTPTGADFFRYEFFAGNAQSGYVENQINLGLTGSALFYGALLMVIASLFRRAYNVDHYARTMLAVLVAMLILGIVAPIFMPVNQAFWILIAIPMFDRFGPLYAPRIASFARVGTPIACFFSPALRSAIKPRTALA
jgi:exopolysaccharide production protein ExoQ